MGSRWSTVFLARATSTYQRTDHQPSLSNRHISSIHTWSANSHQNVFNYNLAISPPRDPGIGRLHAPSLNRPNGTTSSLDPTLHRAFFPLLIPILLKRLEMDKSIDFVADHH
jgi:hypothetical protein